jgi:hypothetical protein
MPVFEDVTEEKSSVKSETTHDDITQQFINDALLLAAGLGLTEEVRCEEHEEVVVTTEGRQTD